MERLKPISYRLTTAQVNSDTMWQQKFYKMFKHIYKNERRSTESTYYRSVFPLVKYFMKTSYWVQEQTPAPVLALQSPVC